MEGNPAAVGDLIRIIQGEMAPGLGEISATLSRITAGTVRTVVSDVPRPSVWYVVFYLPLK